ncbi:MULTISPECIES: YlbF family regulator [unclassified Rummeliibacillus]|uniref:YlbF family regulator n=1 Tax=unclassified Rummeliibacillus TaxID=2622809 RepID=UPI000E665EAB|nr:MULTISPECIES: YlbF family regulator [unclassified Rummeliibacillus]RIJ69139.1 YlbF family regulator [Rummeliibacillus sp. POC4]RPJ94375.1 YlbF family regulator [Rummeliibacillus sp. TYF005]
MMMTSEWVMILEEVQDLNTMIRSSEQFANLQKAHLAVYSDEELVRKINDFQRMKDQYEDVQRFGKYHPDYQTIMKSVRAKKRELDVNDKISALRLAENDYQDLLDEIGLLIGKTVSDSIKVPVSNPFFQSESSCSSGGCGSGGSCSCSA